MITKEERARLRAEYQGEQDHGAPSTIPVLLDALDEMEAEAERLRGCCEAAAIATLAAEEAVEILRLALDAQVDAEAASRIMRMHIERNELLAFKAKVEDAGATTLLGDRIRRAEARAEKAEAALRAIVWSDPGTTEGLRRARGVCEEPAAARNAPNHPHTVAGRWDSDNGPSHASKPCAWCKAWEVAGGVVAEIEATR